MTRRLILNIHLLLGLIAGPILVVLGVTGAILVFAEPLDRALAPGLLVVTPSSERAMLEAIVSPARRTRPGAAIARVVLPQQADQSVEVRFDDGMSVFVDPYSTRVLGSRRTSGHAVLALHERLASGPVGGLLVGVATVAALFSAATDLFLWWPRGVWRLRRRRSAVYVHPYEGRALRTLSTRQRDLATAVLNGRRSVHTGEIFGWPSEALACLVSLALPIEVVSGLLIWWNRRRHDPS